MHLIYKKVNFSDINQVYMEFEAKTKEEMFYSSYSLLQLAILFKDINLIIDICIKGADINVTNLYGYSALDVAIGFNHICFNLRLQIIKILIHFGAHKKLNVKANEELKKELKFLGIEFL